MERFARRMQTVHAVAQNTTSKGSDTNMKDTYWHNKGMHADLFQPLGIRRRLPRDVLSSKRMRCNRMMPTNAQHENARRIMSRSLKAVVAIAMRDGCTLSMETVRQSLTETFGERRMKMHARVVSSLLDGLPAIVQEWQDLLPFDPDYGLPARGAMWQEHHTSALDVFAAGMPTVQEVDALLFLPLANQTGCEGDIESDCSDNTNTMMFGSQHTGATAATGMLKANFAHWWNRASKLDIMIHFGPQQGPREIAHVMMICDSYNQAADAKFWTDDGLPTTLVPPLHTQQIMRVAIEQIAKDCVVGGKCYATLQYTVSDHIRSHWGDNGARQHYGEWVAEETRHLWVLLRSVRNGICPASDASIINPAFDDTSRLLCGANNWATSPHPIHPLIERQLKHYIVDAVKNYGRDGFATKLGSLALLAMDFGQERLEGHGHFASDTYEALALAVHAWRDTPVNLYSNVHSVQPVTLQDLKDYDVHPFNILLKGVRIVIVRLVSQAVIAKDVSLQYKTVKASLQQLLSPEQFEQVSALRVHDRFFAGTSFHRSYDREIFWEITGKLLDRMDRGGLPGPGQHPPCRASLKNTRTTKSFVRLRKVPGFAFTWGHLQMYQTRFDEIQKEVSMYETQGGVPETPIGSCASSQK